MSCLVFFYITYGGVVAESQLLIIKLILMTTPKDTRIKADIETTNNKN